MLVLPLASLRTPKSDRLLGDGLSRRPRKWQHRGGTTFSGDFSLTQDEIDEYERRVAGTKGTPENKAKAEKLSAMYHEGKVDELAEHQSICREEEARKLIPKQTPTEREGRECFLQPNNIVEIQGQQLTASELFERGSEYDNAAMPDPIEGSGYGTTTAKFYYNDGLSPCIHSFAHGLKTVYRLKIDEGTTAAAGTQDHGLQQTGHHFDIDLAQPLDPSTFPHQKLRNGGEIRLLATIQNVNHLLKGYGIEAKYDVIC